MPDSTGARWALRTSAAAILLTVLAVLGVPAASGVTIARAAADEIGNVDVGAVVADLADDGVAGVTDPVLVTALREQIERAGSAVDLSVVVLATDVEGAGPTEVAAAIKAEVGGTVLILSPGHVEAISATVGERDLDQAVEGSRLSGEDRAVVTAFVDSLTDPGFPWSLLITLLVLAAVVALVGGGLWERRRRRRRDAQALAELTADLQRRVGEVAPGIVTLTDQVVLVPRLKDRFAAAASEYADLRSRLDIGPVPDRDTADALAGRVDALRDEVAALRAAAEGTAP